MTDTGLHVEFNPSGINLSTGGRAAQKYLIITELVYWKGQGSTLAGPGGLFSFELSHKELRSAWCESNPCVRGCAVLFSLAEQRIRVRLGFLRAGGRGGSKQRCSSNAKGTVLTSGFPSAARYLFIQLPSASRTQHWQPMPRSPIDTHSFLGQAPWPCNRGPKVGTARRSGCRHCGAAPGGGRCRAGGDARQGAAGRASEPRGAAGRRRAAANPGLGRAAEPRSPARRCPGSAPPPPCRPPPPPLPCGPECRRRRRLPRRTDPRRSAPGSAHPAGLEGHLCPLPEHFGRYRAASPQLAPRRSRSERCWAPAGRGWAEREGKKGGRSPPPPPAAAGTAPGSRSSGAGGEPEGSRAAAAGARRAAVRAGKGCGGGGEPRPAATCPARPLPSDGRGAASFGRRPPLYGEFRRGREGGGGGASRSGGWRDGGMEAVLLLRPGSSRGRRGLRGRGRRGTLRALSCGRGAPVRLCRAPRVGWRAERHGGDLGNRKEGRGKWPSGGQPSYWLREWRCLAAGELLACKSLLFTSTVGCSSFHFLLHVSISEQGCAFPGCALSSGEAERWARFACPGGSTWSCRPPPEVRFGCVTAAHLLRFQNL